MKRILSGCFLVFIALDVQAQNTNELTVDKIMRDPKWMGVSPTNIEWSDDSKKIFFSWNKDSINKTSIYQITPKNIYPVKLSETERKILAPFLGNLNTAKTQKVYEKNGDLFLLTTKTGQVKQLFNTTEREFNGSFSKDESAIIFQRADNLFSINILSGVINQLTNFSRTKPKTPPIGSVQDNWLKKQQEDIFDIIKKESKEKKELALESKENAVKRPKEILIDDKFINNIQLSPDAKFITYRLVKLPESHIADVPNYLDATGYTEDIATRTKVGNQQAVQEYFIYDIKRDTFYAVNTKDLPGVKDLPDYLKDYPKQLAAKKEKNEDRKLNFGSLNWNLSGSQSIITITAQDNKDRWLAKLDVNTGKLSVVERQRDEAWIGGPGISSFGNNTGWVNDRQFFYQSEATGYSHLYIVDTETGVKKQLTTGKYEVQSVRLSNDKKWFYLTANIDHPGVTHFYKLNANGGLPQKLTSLKGGHEVSLSPDEKWLAYRYSYINKPWELYIQEAKPDAKPIQITQSLTKEFKSYNWKTPEVITFNNRYGSPVYARIYQPQKPNTLKPAVIFVHGAGYLQNAHFWWSQYFREYMFHNLLVDKGYTVLDIDYTGSSGYGRDHRTGIYRHMGGKDLTDHVDGAKLLTEKYGVNPKRIGIYGGSYGGFITLMGMFTTPDVFAAGAGLRSVTDWAHYNHGYTSNILNEPYNDEIAYKRSSPIYFANGLTGRLLMCHGMLDLNVHFQDIVRLSQRLIELKKENWELAVYPIEDHGFEESSSWTDEYKRILKLFDETLKNN